MNRSGTEVFGPIPRVGDEPLHVAKVEVSEQSPYAVFVVSGPSSQPVELELAPGAANPAGGSGVDFGSSSGQGIEYWNGTAWTPYTGEPASVNTTGKLLVRVPITSDTELDGGETFQLTATDSGGRTSTGIATIKDDGTGTLYTAGDPVGDTPPVSPVGSFEEPGFAVAPQAVGLFEALQDLTVAIRAGDHKRMSRGLGELDRMMNRLAFNISEVGTDLHVADMQTEVVEETQLQLKTVLSNAQDLDYAEAVTRMQKQMLSLEAAQRSFGQISQLSLFDYIN